MTIALGTAQFGLSYGIANQCGQVTRTDAAKIITAARASGVDTIDTAIAYGDSELCLGEVGIDGFKVVTKLPLIPDDVPDVTVWINEHLRASLHRLRQAKIYGLLLHRSHQLSGERGTQIVKALEHIKAQGLVQKIGVSIYAPEELENVTRSCAIDLVQAPLNLIDRRLVESGWLQRLVDKGIEIHARSIFLQGLLLISADQIPAKFARWQKLWQTWHVWQTKNPEVTPVQACLRYVADLAGVDQIVVGVDNLGQLNELLAAVSGTARYNWPAISSTDLDLIHPSNWNQL